MNKTIKLSKIKITPEFSSCKPRSNKLKSKYDYYWEYSQFKEPIVLNHKNELIDGYTTYLICKMLGIKNVEVTYNKDIKPKKMNKILAGAIATLLVLAMLICVLSMNFLPDIVFRIMCIDIISLTFGFYVITIWKKIYNKLSGDGKYNDK